MNIKMSDYIGSFAENKDKARLLRLEKINPALNEGKDIVLDFQGVEATTQSFIHALISEVLRQHGSEVLEKISFKSCTPAVQKIIEIVVEYTQEGMMD